MNSFYSKVQYYLKLLSLPLIFLVVFSSLFVFWDIFNLPEPEELQGILQSWFDTYGLPALFFASIVEGALLVGGYFPGVFVIFLGIAISDSILEAVQTTSVVTLGLFSAHMINFFLGKYGWYRLLVRFGLRGAIERARRRVERGAKLAIFSSYWLPSLAALTDTAAGIIQMSFKKFFYYSVTALISWNIFIGTLVYVFKDFAILISTPGSWGAVVIYSAIFLWIVFILVSDHRERKKNIIETENMIT